MDKVALGRKRIADIVDENYVHGYVLFFFGIRFYEYFEQTLEEVCRQRGLKIDQVIRELESPSQVLETNLPLVSYPTDLIIQYLKHAHFLFIKHKLPYIAGLIDSFQARHDDYLVIERDLKLVFPLFVEDFIHHIYEEEDTLFNHISQLERALQGKIQPGRLYYLLERHSVQKFALEHEVHDDEMEGIRRITSDYAINEHTPLHIRVLYNELSAFEKSLINHARIENDILFPKAMALENKVRNAFFEKSKLN